MSTNTITAQYTVKESARFTWIIKNFHEQDHILDSPEVELLSDPYISLRILPKSQINNEWLSDTVIMYLYVSEAEASLCYRVSILDSNLCKKYTKGNIVLHLNQGFIKLLTRFVFQNSNGPLTTTTQDA